MQNHNHGDWGTEMSNGESDDKKPDLKEFVILAKCPTCGKRYQASKGHKCSTE